MYLRVIVSLVLLCGVLYAEGDTSVPESGEKVSKKIALPKKVLRLKGVKQLEEASLYKSLGVELPGMMAFWKDKTPYIKEKMIPVISQTLRSFYDSEGYYDATFKVDESKELVTVTIDEGEPVRVDDINISSDFDISQEVTFHKGEVFTARQFITVKSKIAAALLKEGYCSYDMDAKAYVDLDTHRVDLRFKVKKGGVCTFGEVTVKGMETVDPEIVKSRVRAKKGERFSTELVQDTSTAIYSLQAFDSVLINIDRKIYNVVPVDIMVQEMKNPYHIEAGLGYDTFVGPRVHTTFVKHNFMGNAQQLSLGLAWSSLQKLARIDFYKPVIVDIGGFDIDLGSSVGYSDLEFDGFREKKAWGKAFVKHESNRFSFTGGLSFESIEIDQLDDGVCVLPCPAYDTYLLAYPYLDVVYDARDSKLNPKYGYYLSGYVEYGIPTNPESSLYLKSEFEARGIYTVSELTMAIVGKIGAIDIADDSYRGIPESKKFFAGGAYFNRAYGFREIGVITSPSTDLINGALSMANLSLEADYPVWGDLYGAVFTDNTMLTDKRYDYSGDIITSAGVGVRYMTPVGPFKLDVGFNVDDPTIYGISFQIGQSF